ncbi:hypothetical protein SAMN04487977_101491 [Treponema bryantii]|uniref:PD-(D/E)XK nuclease superfamily protein n=1 Tax=Treponema bryantii TaxID=163 RepID=A0A1H9AW16_9SPIR|nr:hypothetical protein [Treponema bryantii]SEP80940.1 hypothetical protein SAMN04487977_101491 [Treponema bryantii]
MKYLITSSLLDSYDWLISCPKDWKDRAVQEFIAMIKREERPTSEACQRGIDFENLVCQNCNNLNDEQFKMYARQWYEARGVKGYDVDIAVYPTLKIAQKCRNGQQQVPVMKDVQFGDKEFHLFGYADIMFPNKIIDIKTTGKYKGGYHYVKRSQHYMYSLCTGINTFEYLVADYKESRIPRDVHEVEFEMRQEENLWVLEKRIKDVMNYLEKSGLYKDYVEIFTAKHDDNKKKGA